MNTAANNTEHGQPLKPLFQSVNTLQRQPNNHEMQSFLEGTCDKDGNNGFG